MWTSKPEWAKRRFDDLVTKAKTMFDLGVNGNASALDRLSEIGAELSTLASDMHPGSYWLLSNEEVDFLLRFLKKAEGMEDTADRNIYEILLIKLAKSDKGV